MLSSSQSLTSGYDLSSWQVETVRAVEESHLVAWSRERTVRDVFTVGMWQYLDSLPDTQVCKLRGERIVDLDTFCEEFERAMPGDRLEPRFEGPDGILDRLRRRHTPPGGRPAKRRFYLWPEAQVLLKHDPRLFGRLADALAGVAAEAEFVSEDLLLLHRAIFVGSAALDMYAEDPRGQFQRWYVESVEEPLWSVIAGVESPRFRRLAVDRAMLHLPAVA